MQRLVRGRKIEKMISLGYKVIDEEKNGLTLMEKEDVVEKPKVKREKQKVKREKISKPKVVEQPILEEKVEEIV